MNFAPNDAENVLTFLSRAHGTLKSSFLCTHQRQPVSVSLGTRKLGGDMRAAFPHLTVQLVSSVRNFIIKTQDIALSFYYLTLSSPRKVRIVLRKGEAASEEGAGRRWPFAPLQCLRLIFCPAPTPLDR